MWSEIAASFQELWFAMPPGLQAAVFLAGAVMALITYCLFLTMLDRVFSDVWGPEEPTRAAALRRREVHQRELKAIVSQRFQ